MKNKKILGGLVVVAVLLSGTTVLYFAGVERAGVTPALADQHEIGGGGGGGDCGGCTEPGTFCAVLLSNGGGYNNVPCCPEGQWWCGSWYRERVSFPEVGSDPCGSCWKYDSSTAPWCNEWWCNNFYVCPAVYCQRMNPRFVRTRNPPVRVSGGCLPMM